MFALPHNPALRKQILHRVWNEYRYAKNELEDLLASEELSEQKIRLYVVLMKSCSWYQLLSVLTEKELQQALNTKVITKLWPKSLQKRFQHAARLLYPETISPAG
jgi:hypothetical protein